MEPTPPSSHGTPFLRVVALLAFALVVTVLSSLGTYWYMSKQLASQQSPEESNQPTPIIEQTINVSPTVTKDETADWKAYTTKQEPLISFKYPTDNGWQVFDNKIAEDFPDYPKGYRSYTGVDYKLCGPNCGLVFRIDVYVKGSEIDPGNQWGEKQMQGNNFYKLSSKQSVTKSGVSGTRWEYSPGDNTVAKIIYYYFRKNNYSYTIGINSNGALTDKVDLTERGEKIFSTVQFLQ